MGDIVSQGLLASIARKKITGGGTSPGTTNLVAAYDFNNTVPGEGKDDSHTNGYDLTENNSPTYVTTAPAHVVCSGTAYLSSTDLSANWADQDGDWTLVTRFRWNSSIPNNQSIHYSGGGRDYLRTKSGNVYAARLGAGTEITVTASIAYDGDWTTVIMQHDTSADETTIYFLNENLSATQGSVTGDWNVSVAEIGSTSASYDIDYAYYFSQIFTEDERKFFGDNSSNAIVYSDL